MGREQTSDVMAEVAGDRLTDGVLRALSRGQVIDITTLGRRSGKPHRIEIVFHNIDGNLYISGMPSRRKRNWIANLEANPRFTFHLKRGVQADLPATARVITDEEERRSILAHIARIWGRHDLEIMVQYSPLIEVIIDGRAA